MLTEIFIVSHGFFDFFHFNYLLEHTIQYLFIICLFMLFYHIFQPFAIFSFLIMSKIHFDNDIKNVVEMARYIDYQLGYNLGIGEFNSKMGSVLFLSTLCSVYNLNYWLDILGNIINNSVFTYPIIVFFAVYLFYDIIRIRMNLNEKLFMGFVFVSGIYLGPYYQMLYYMAFIHTPLSLCNTAFVICGNHCLIVKYSLMIFYVILVNIVIICFWEFVLKNYIYLLYDCIPYIIVPLLQTHIILHNTRFFN